MKQWNYRYTDRESFEAYIKEKGVEKSDSLLIQITTGEADAERVDTIRDEILRVLPFAVIIGMGSALQLCEGDFSLKETVLTLTLFEKSHLSEWSFVLPPDEECDADRVAQLLASHVTDDTKGILLFTNAVSADIESLFIACRSYISIPVFGGLASSFDPDNPSPFVISTEKVFCEDAAVAVLLKGEALSIHFSRLFAWESIGKEFTVTRAEGRRLYELDGKNIMDVYSKYFGPLTRERLLYLSLAHPFIRHSKEFGEVSRVLLQYDGECGIYTGRFEEGEKVQIGFGNYKKMVDCTDRSRELFSQIPMEAFWGFACISYMRGYTDLLKKSLLPYRKNFPSIHFAITFGEFGWIDGINSFMNNTIVRVSLSEDPEARFVIEDVDIDLDEKDRLLETLSTLVTSSSREIIELNRYLEEEVKKRTQELADLNASLARRIEQEVQRNREKDKMLYHQSKLAAMGEMINNIAHQWRQPLNIIALVMQDLSLKSKLGNLTPEMVVLAEKKINDTLKYLSDTIDDFRSFASEREESSRPGRFEAGKMIKDAIRLISVVLEDVHIRLRLELPEIDCEVNGRANDLKQVILNLVYNAIDILKEREIENPEITIGMRCDGKVILYVHDNGGGIEKELLDKIFEPYFTTKYQSRGSGLGLYMSKMIVEKRFKGEIEVKNCPEGACFEIKIPVAAVVA
ncbi:FIST N-terminal domain-containing protein [Hydrogenimonas urashimensis]|uniref:FIST N-terminal domain-containing protein n=1 Tax=Hydrogenimonas urashimensis TaxID=2740515 RepID=UPI001915E5DA|nr:FIST N-terminal domain-containing protein [Hydrogenimonas urashimensis]